jgi:hypothetical protein
MNGLTWEKKYRDTTIAEDFKNQLGGKFWIHIDYNQLFYEKDGVARILPEDENACWDIISRSVQEKKNLLLELPLYKPRYRNPFHEE